MAAIIGSLPLLTIPFDPLPAPPGLSWGGGELFSRGYEATWSGKLPRPGEFTLFARARSAASKTGTGVVVITDNDGRVVSRGEVRAAGERLEVVPAGPPFKLEANRQYRVTLRESAAPLGIDYFELRSRTENPIRLEGERAKVSVHAHKVPSSEASGGAWIGSIAAPGVPLRVEQTFRGNGKVMNGFAVHLTYETGSKAIVSLALRDKTADRTLYEFHGPAGDLPRIGEIVRFRVAPTPALDHEFELTYEQPAEGGCRIPLAMMETDPNGSLLVNGLPLGARLLFVQRHESAWRKATYVAAPLVWIAVLAGVALHGRRRDVLAATIVVLLAIVSATYWQRDYQFTGPSHWMPDGYGGFSERIRAALDDAPGVRSSLRGEMRSYAHAHSPLVPFLVALGSYVVPPVKAYLVLAYLAGLVATLGLLRILEEIPWLPPRDVWLLWSLGTTHFLFVRVLARTNTDVFGYCFVVLGIWLACRLGRSERWALAHWLALCGIIVVGLFSRPTVVPLSGALALGLIVTAWRNGNLTRRTTALAVALGALPLLCFFGGVWIAGLWQTFEIARVKMTYFAEGRTVERLVICLSVLLQLLLVPLIAGARRMSERTEPVVGAFWAGASLIFVIATATFWNRHFLHALPGVLLAAAPGMQRLRERSPRLVSSLALLSVAANLSLVVFNIYRDFGIGAPYLLQ
ncbi:MAG: glycosyltransferase family 39 protein [Thermoanaerobaculia bacterium]|nr:glycosyltransferase family 39 protein [Thermoanaerobaculia bacterium]